MKTVLKLLLTLTIPIHIIFGNVENNSSINAKTYKILPLGNSITFDNRAFDTRNIGEKDGYRGPLYNLLKNSGFNFDFIGSEHSGGSFLPAGFDENAGFPGITDDQLLYLLKTGHLLQLDQGIDRQITAGPYLNSFSPDVILMHIGTNNNDQPDGTSASEIEQILDQIDLFEQASGKDVTVLLARIINRVPNQSYVNDFNNNIETMVLDRINNPLNNAYPDNIKIVDMQDSADFIYTISPDPNGGPGDMHDQLHPNDKGYSKMAKQWFNALKLVLPNPPEIVSQPSDYYSVEGASARFAILVQGEGPFLYQWKKNGSNIYLATDSILNLNNININDNNSIITCSVTNSNGTVISQNAILYVNSKYERVKMNLQVEYDFEEGEGSEIKNKVVESDDLNLQIFSPQSVSWILKGISITDVSNISTLSSVTSLIDSINISNAFTFELWFSISNLNQSGPARIITISANDTERNFTFGQNSDSFVIRTRTTETDLNGLPELNSEMGIVENELIHAVVSKDKGGVCNLYVNGTLNNNNKIDGDLSNWSNQYRLAIGNEFMADKSWIGNIYHFAIYNRNLTEEEIQHNYSLGEDGVTSVISNPPVDNNYFALYQNYPNPFNPSTKINFDLPEASKVSLTIYNILGQQIMKVLNKDFSAGRYNYDFDGSNLTSGIYIYSLTASGVNGNNFTQSRKMILVK